MASHQRQHPSQSSQQHPHHHRTNNPPNTAIRAPNLNHNGSSSQAMAAAAAAANGDGDLYQQLIDSNDLVKELDDIEAISQQISQHAEVLYQSWKQQEANKQHQNQSEYNYQQSNTLPSNPGRTSSIAQLPSHTTGSLPRVGGYQPGDFTKRATSPLKVQENGRAPSNGGVIPISKQNGNHNPNIHHNMSNDRNLPSSNQPPYPTDLQHSSSSFSSGSSQPNSYQNIKRQNGTHTTNHNALSSSASGLSSPSFISSASNAASLRSNTLPGSARLHPVNQQNFPQTTNSSSTPLDSSFKSSTLPHSNVSNNNSNAISNNLLSEGSKSNPKSSETVGRSLELLATPEVNGNLKDLVNSFVSTDRAKQAARQTISNTINNMSRRNGNGIRSTSPSSNTASSSPFSSRGVSPLRSPMLAAASNNTGPQAVLNSLHAVSSTPPSTMSTSSLSSINTNLHHPPPLGNPHPPGPLSPSASSTSSTSSSIDSQMNRSISTTSSTDPTSNIHTKLNPMFSRTPSSNTSSLQQQKTPASPSWPSEQNTIPIPVQHIRTNDAGKATSSSTLMMTGVNNGNRLNSNNLSSPRVLQNMTSSSAPTSHSSVGGDNHQKQLQPPVRQTSLEFNLQPPNLSSLHDQHLESMRQKFEEAKQRMNLLHERVRTGSESSLISTRPPGLSLRSPFNGGDPFEVDSVDGGLASDDSSNHSSYLFDQFRRRVARSKRETPSAPHPELTPQQRQHIFERTSSTGSLFPLNAAGAPNRRFPSGGSVAERVLIFERSPFAVEGRSLSAGNLAENKKEGVSNVPNWKSSQYEAQQKAQVRIQLGFIETFRQIRVIR